MFSLYKFGAMKCILIIFTVISTSAIFAQDEIGDNDLRIIDAIYHQMDSISIESTVTLLTYINRRSNNVEFIEYRAETLLKLLKHRPDMYLLGMCSLEDTFMWKPVLAKIESPVSDIADMKEIKAKMIEYGMLKESCQLEVLEKTLQSIDKAIVKSDNIKHD